MIKGQYKIFIYEAGKVREEELALSDFYIGRSKTAGVCISHSELSRKHLDVQFRNDKVYIRDLNTTNGSFVNGIQIGADEWFHIRPEDKIYLGKSEDIYLQVTAEIESNILPLEKQSSDKYSDKTIYSTHGAAARKALVTDPIDANQEIQEIQAISERIPEVKLSEVEMLQVKKLEIDAQMAAIQIKKEAEQEVQNLKEQAKLEILELQEKSDIELAQAKESIIQFKQEIEELHDEMAKLCEDKRSTQADIESLEQDGKQIDHEILVKKAELDQLIKDGDEKLLAAKEELSEIIEEKDRRIDEFESELVKEQERIDLLKHDLEAEYHGFRADLEQQQNQLLKNIKELEESQNELSLSIDQENSKRESLGKEIETLLEENKLAKKDYERMQDRLDQLFKEKNQKTDEIKFQEQRQDELNLKIEKAHHDLISLGDQKEELENLNQQLQEKYDQELIEGRIALEAKLDQYRLEQERAQEQELEQKKVAAQKLLDDMNFEARTLKQQAEQNLQESKAAKESAEKEIQEKVQLAIHEYESTVLAAKEKKDKILSDANEKAAVLINESQNKSNSLIQAAQEKAVALHQESLKELEKTRQGLGLEIDEAKSELEGIHENIEKQSALFQQVKRQIEDQKEQASLEIASQREEILQIAKQEADELLQKGKIESEKFQKAAQIKFDTVQKEENAKIAKLRAQNQELITHEKEKVLRELDSWKKNTITDHAQAIENLVQLKLKSLVGKQIKESDILVEAKKIKTMVRDSFGDKHKAQQSLLGQLNPYGSSGRGKSIRVMKRLGIGALCCGILFLGNALVPGGFLGVFSGLSSKLKEGKTAQEIFTEKLEKQKELNRKAVVFEQELQIRETLTESVLYTKDFTKNWNSKKFQGDWGIRVEQLIAYQMVLKDAKVDQYLNLELKLVKDLQAMRDTITEKNQDSVIKEMLDYEYQHELKMKELLENADNYDDMLDAREDFYNKFAK